MLCGQKNWDGFSANYSSLVLVLYPLSVSLEEKKQAEEDNSEYPMQMQHKKRVIIAYNNGIVSDVDLWMTVQLHIFVQPSVCEY